VFHSVPDLITAIEADLHANNASPRPFVWTATAEAILAKVRRGRVALAQLASKQRGTTLMVPADPLRDIATRLAHRDPTRTLLLIRHAQQFRAQPPHLQVVDGISCCDAPIPFRRQASGPSLPARPRLVPAIRSERTSSCLQHP